MVVIVDWISDEKVSKKGKKFYSILVSSADVRGWGVVYEPVKVGTSLHGRFDFCRDKPCFFVTDGK